MISLRITDYGALPGKKGAEEGPKEHPVRRLSSQLTASHGGKIHAPTMSSLQHPSGNLTVATGSVKLKRLNWCRVTRFLSRSYGTADESLPARCLSKFDSD